MSDSTHQPPSEAATVALHDVARRVDALAAAWEGDDLPPNLADFLPPKPLALRQMVLIELVKLDLEYRWQQHELPKQVEEYATEYPELAEQGEIPCSLIYEEFHVRRNSSQPSTPDEYFTRFPQQVDQLRRMMATDAQEADATTATGRGGQVEYDAGQQIDDFDLLVRLGKGSFGSVFLARQRSMQRIVALKISKDRGVEPQTLAQLDHPNIVRVYDQRVLPDQRLQLMYMQHIPGGTLSEVLEVAKNSEQRERRGKTLLKAVDESLDRQGATPPEESTVRRRLAGYSWPETICWIGSRLAAALAYAHQRGVLHRDIKPANVLLAADGSPKLVDFNVSFSSTLEGATAAAYFGGSLVYMSPEQIEAYNPKHHRNAAELDGRSDIYSLGLVLYELLTCSRPFMEENLQECVGNTPKLLIRLAERRLAGLTPEALAKLPTNLPPGFREVLVSCLAPNPSDRPATAGALARQLDLCLQPGVQALLQPPAESKLHLLRRWPVTFFIVIGLMPSVVLSTLNLAVNAKAIVGDKVKSFFWDVEVPVINGVMFPIAIFMVVRFGWPVLKLVRRLVARENVERTELPPARHRALWIGDYSAWLGMALWVVTGIAFPAWLRMHFGDVEGAGTQVFRNFIASQIASGWISSTITFFLLTVLFVHTYYPVLVRPEQNAADEVADLKHLERRCGWCFYLAVAAPFLALALAVPSLSSYPLWMLALTGIGFVCCAVSFKMLQVIRADLANLALALDPERESGDSSAGNSTTSMRRGVV